MGRIKHRRYDSCPALGSILSAPVPISRTLGRLFGWNFDQNRRQGTRDVFARDVQDVPDCTDNHGVVNSSFVDFEPWADGLL